tara:strand:+ start:1302 stop:1625 length:324 start_codon:yes stop_codon:yes gene_type:complete
MFFILAPLVSASAGFFRIAEMEGDEVLFGEHEEVEKSDEANEKSNGVVAETKKPKAANVRDTLIAHFCSFCALLPALILLDWLLPSFIFHKRTDYVGMSYVTISSTH